MTRPRLERDVLGRRVHVVRAGAGFGKTTLVTGWAEAVPSVLLGVTPAHRAAGTLARALFDGLRLRVPGLGAPLSTVLSDTADLAPDPTALAAEFGDRLAVHLARDLALVLDNVDELEGSEGAVLLDGLVRHAPERLHFVLAGRGDPPVRLSRLRVAGSVEDLDAADLAFTADETAELLTAELGDAGRELAERVHAATSGWPVAVRLVCETVRRGAAHDAARLLDPGGDVGGTLVAYLAEEVLASESPDARRALAVAATVGAVDVALAGRLGVADAAGVLARLRGRGLYFDSGAEPLQLSPLVAGHPVVAEALTGADRREVLRAGAVWHRGHGRWAECLELLRRLGDPEELTATVVDHAAAMLDAGAAAALVSAVESVPPSERPPALERAHAEACRTLGDGDGALAILTRLTGASGELDPALAWRTGLIHHLRGEVDRALAVYRRGDSSGASPDVAMLLAWRAAALWVTADLTGSRELAERALDVAASCGDDRALGTAHTVMAMVAALAGDRAGNEAHYLRALHHAERAGDVWQQMRIHANRGSRHEEEGNYAESIAETEQALRLAELTGNRTFEPLALLNRGRARLRLGAVDEAVADFTAARVRWEATGSRHSAYASAALGDVHHLRGDRAQAEAAYRSAIEVAEPQGDAQALVPALAGLALVLVHDDPDEALRLAQRAVEHAAALDVVGAHLALGHVHLRRGDHHEAVTQAGLAQEVAGVRRDRRGLAQALELAAESDPRGDRAATEERLDEALRLWQDLGSPLDEIGNRLARMRLWGGAPEELADVIDAATRLGARGLVAAARDLDRGAEPGRRVRIRTLGGFGVDRGGRQVPLAAWQSKKARDLLKILVARRGTAVHREELMEALWPGEPASRTSNRLSVALSTLRGVLDVPGRPVDAPVVVTDRVSVRLDLSRVDVDVELFLADAERGLRLAGAADPGARELLARAEAAYLGDVLPEDAYDEELSRLREQARASFVAVARALARIEDAAGRPDAAARHYQRLLAVDPFDEAAHLGLVAAVSGEGQHGEARRVYEQYAARMGELGLDPAPFPGSPARAVPPRP
ncbi:MAG: BTAD domain-containing putative transcriptional regulator [Nocardioidaceae bacterium]